MRQRKVKNEAERLAALEEYMIREAIELKGRWNDYLRQMNQGFKRSIFLELGCGRGHFLVAHAEQNPEDFYIGAEGRSSIVLRALELIQENKLLNALCIPDYIENIEDYFAEDELSGIYLNFSDPWPKARHAKRRLTHRRYLEGYKRVLKRGSFIEIKTDNDDFFNFTLEECYACGLTIKEHTQDLHKTNLSARLITTQYEERFRLLKKSINYCKIMI
ncbi:MAG: tRNA (guanosine(46)-N7)-methyltransferase TrmB [Eubacteriales bacterium]|nr:tRNA (guanosine(46)-N7)-methyltransferase TrmB [Eubacteriales bacterium]MDD4583193.1 tRNA (guanosine(46)-N7)-methyltransferase TrmB [Eubacteriales bacterium]